MVVEFNWEYPGQQVRHRGERADYNLLLQFFIIISLRLIKTLDYGYDKIKKSCIKTNQVVCETN